MTDAGGRERTRSATVAIAVLLLVASILVVVLPTSAAPIVPFSARFSADDNGTVAIFGNNLLSCPTSDSRCAGARAGTTSLNNNGFAMQNLDVDADASTFNSSSTQVSAPPSGEVLWAGLYWGARLSRANGGVAGVGDRKVMQLRAPGASSYSAVTSQAGFGPTSGDQAYQEFADVTSLVRTAGAGTYWGANVVAGTGEDRYAGWSLVVVYRAPGLPLRNLTVFDGFADVGRDEPQQVNLSGFRTPVTGAVETQLGMVAYEGDFSTSGDSARLGSTLLSTTPLSRGSNFFNGTNDDNGASVAARNPAHLNMLGYDIKNLAASGIPNGATSATISLESTGDRYFPGVVTTAIGLFAPDFSTSTKTVANLAGRTPALPGDELEYTLTYPNTGQDPATLVELTDTLPPGTTFVSAAPSSGTCTGAARDVSCTIGTIGVGQTWQARVRATVDPDAAGTTLVNAAVLDYRAATLGRDLTYVVAPATIAVDAVADLSLTKSLSVGTGVAGTEVTSTLTVANAGPNAATGVVVTDQLPAGVTFVSATTPQGTCAASAGVVTCDLGTVADDAVVDIEVVVGIPSGSNAESIVNVASVTAATADLAPGDNAAGASAAVVRDADLSVVKTATDDEVVPGATTTFTVTVTNDGPSDAASVVLTDTVQDPALVLTSAEAPGATCSFSGSAARCQIPTLAAGAQAVMTVGARVSPDAAEGVSVDNVATTASNTPDSDPSDNTDTVTIDVAEPLADIETAKTARDAVAGGQIAYTVVVTNRGPSTAQAVNVEDVLPAGLTVASATSSRGTCTTGSTISCELGDLPGPDAAGIATSATITIVADVAPDAPVGALSNTATASTTTTDPDPADDAATATSTVSALADVSVTKTATPTQPAAGENVTFTMVVTNAGPSTARDVELVDPLPPGLIPAGATSEPGVSCDGAATVTCDIGDLAPGASTTVTVTMTIPADFDLDVGAVNTATVTGSTPDPAAGNNAATATVTARALSDLIAFKWDTTDLPPAPGTPGRSFAAGEIVTYKLAVGNFGPSDASSARVVDTLPPGVTYLDSVPECRFEPPNQVVCDLPTVPTQFAAIIPVRVQVDPGLAEGTQLTNSVQITLLDPDRVDPVSSNNFAAVTNPIVTSADLNIVKRTYSLDLPAQTFTVPSSAPAGALTGYALDIRNDGLSIARDVVVVDSSTMTDFFVNRVVLIRANAEPVDLTAACAWSGGDLQCPIGDLPVFAATDPSWLIQVDGVTLSNAAPGDYVNTATLTSVTPDGDPADNTSQAPITVTDPVATLTIDKAVVGGSDVDGDGQVDIVPGTPFGYQLTVENIFDPAREGASDAAGVVVTDTLPPGLTPTSATSTQGTCEIILPSTVTCTLGTVLGPGRMPQPPPVLITVSGTAATGLSTGTTLTNTATVSSPISADATDSVSQSVIAVADIAITKVPDAAEVAAGSVAGFSLIVTNAGPSDAEVVDVADLLPPELTFEPAASDPACNLATEGDVTYVQCLIGTLAVGESRTVRVGARIAPDQAPTTVTNTAAAGSQIVGGDFDFSNNISEAEIAIVASADLVAGKTADSTGYRVGSNVTYTATVTNAGPSSATDVVLSDPVPAGLTFVGASSADGLTCAFADGSVSCTAPTLAAGAMASATIVLAIPAGHDPGPVTNTVTVSSATPDPVPENDVATVVVEAFILADASVVKSLLTAAPQAGSPLVFAIDVFNAGPQAAPDIVVSDTLEPGFAFVSASGGACSVTRPEGLDIVTCEVESLEIGATARVLVTVLPDADVRSARNGALVGSGAQDARSADNYDEIEFTLAAPDDPSTPTPTPGGPPPAPGSGGGALPATGFGVPIALVIGSLLAVFAGAALTALHRRRSTD